MDGRKQTFLLLHPDFKLAHIKRQSVFEHHENMEGGVGSRICAPADLGNIGGPFFFDLTTLLIEQAKVGEA